jgi:excisionase family DNA binding protein
MKLSIKQAAARAGVSAALVYGWVGDGLVPYYRLGGKGRRGKILIDDADLDAFLASRRVGPAAAGSAAPAPRPPVRLRHLRLPS